MTSPSWRERKERHTERIVIRCLYCAIVYLFLMKYVHVHLTSSTDAFLMIQI